MPVLGTKADIGMNMRNSYSQSVSTLRIRRYTGRDQRKNAGEGDGWPERKQILMPDINITFVGFNIEMLLEYIERLMAQQSKTGTMEKLFLL